MIEMEDEDFLAEVAAAEAEALSSSKRLKVSHTPIPTPVGGAYIEALKGSKGSFFHKQSTSATNTYNNNNNNSNNNNNNNNNNSNLGFSDGGASGTCFTCGKIGHWARDCDLKSREGQGEGEGGRDTDVVDKQCPCGVGVCNVLTAKTERNCGRKFYRCPVRQENGGCGFFEWCENPSGPETVIKASNPSAPELPCPCGAGSCLVLTAKTEKNLGQQFYKCPTTQGGCGFFKWCREVTATDGNLSSTYTSPTSQNQSGMINKSYNSSTLSCYKCGKDGHWAKDCNQSSSYTAPAYQSTVIMSNKSNNSSNSSCYKCGNDGHWARDCNQSSSNDPSNRMVKTASSGTCFKCGNPGHWAKDCSTPSDTKARYGQ